MVHDMKGADSTQSDFQPLHLPPHMTVTIHFVKCVFTFDFFLRFGLCHRKSITEIQNTQNFDSVHMLFVICPHYTTALVLHEKCIHFQPIRST